MSRIPGPPKENGGGNAQRAVPREAPEGSLGLGQCSDMGLRLNDQEDRGKHMQPTQVIHT